MINEQFQTEIFNKAVIDLSLPEADICYQANFLNAGQASAVYQQILEETSLTPDLVTVYGKQHLTPRLTCWMGDADRQYRYSNHTMSPVPWSDVLWQLKTQVEQASAHTFNSVLINYYRNGQDSNGWHADDEPELGDQPVIASLSLGGARDFQLRHKRDRHIKHTISLKHGSLLIMRGATQTHWQHQIPKRAKAQGRLNLTFRQIIR